jgi:hypothetical protein
MLNEVETPFVSKHMSLRLDIDIQNNKGIEYFECAFLSTIQ